MLQDKQDYTHTPFNVLSWWTSSLSGRRQKLPTRKYPHATRHGTPLQKRTTYTFYLLLTALTDITNMCYRPSVKHAHTRIYTNHSKRACINSRRCCCSNRWSGKLLLPPYLIGARYDYPELHALSRYQYVSDLHDLMNLLKFNNSVNTNFSLLRYN